ARPANEKAVLQVANAWADAGVELQGRAGRLRGRQSQARRLLPPDLVGHEAAADVEDEGLVGTVENESAGFPAGAQAQVVADDETEELFLLRLRLFLLLLVRLFLLEPLLHDLGHGVRVGRGGLGGGGRLARRGRLLQQPLERPYLRFELLDAGLRVVRGR